MSLPYNLSIYGVTFCANYPVPFKLRLIDQKTYYHVDTKTFTSLEDVYPISIHFQAAAKVVMKIKILNDRDVCFGQGLIRFDRSHLNTTMRIRIYEGEYLNAQKELCWMEVLLSGIGKHQDAANAQPSIHASQTVSQAVFECNYQKGRESESEGRSINIGSVMENQAQVILVDKAVSTPIETSLKPEYSENEEQSSLAELRVMSPSLKESVQIDKKVRYRFRREQDLKQAVLCIGDRREYVVEDILANQSIMRQIKKHLKEKKKVETGCQSQDRSSVNNQLNSQLLTICVEDENFDAFKRRIGAQVVQPWGYVQANSLKTDQNESMRNSVKGSQNEPIGLPPVAALAKEKRRKSDARKEMPDSPKIRNRFYTDSEKEPNWEETIKNKRRGNATTLKRKIERTDNQRRDNQRRDNQRRDNQTTIKREDRKTEEVKKMRGVELQTMKKLWEKLLLSRKVQDDHKKYNRHSSNVLTVPSKPSHYQPEKNNIILLVNSVWLGGEQATQEETVMGRFIKLSIESKGVYYTEVLFGGQFQWIMKQCVFNHLNTKEVLTLQAYQTIDNRVTLLGGCGVRISKIHFLRGTKSIQGMIADIPFTLGFEVRQIFDAIEEQDQFPMGIESQDDNPIHTNKTSINHEADIPITPNWKRVKYSGRMQEKKGDYESPFEGSFLEQSKANVKNRKETF